ncbi:MAG: DegT/DnrJ/EryC1/StrS family aminotransferase [Bacteroidia bacterium]
MIALQNIAVCQPFMPPMESYTEKLHGIWQRNRITNNGPLVKELEEELRQYLNVPYLHFVANGTIALQIAIRSLELKGDVITTPFSYVASTTSIIWENCQPLFVDIDPLTMCIDPKKIEDAITPETTAIVATHVYGYSCDVEAIRSIADRHGLKVIYDAAHAFGSSFQGSSLLSHGDVTAVSFHATKIFHTVEGGAVITHNEKLAEKMFLMKTFGHREEEFICAGINGKNSEFHAAMGLCVLPYVESLIKARKELWESYCINLANAGLVLPYLQSGLDYNYAYFPVIFQSDKELLYVKERLQSENIITRRYFYPSLNKLPYLKGADCPVAETVAERVLCLPLYSDLQMEQVAYISSIITEALNP